MRSIAPAVNSGKLQIGPQPAVGRPATADASTTPERPTWSSLEMVEWLGG